MYAKRILEQFQAQNDEAHRARPVNPDWREAPLTYSQVGKCDREVGFALLAAELEIESPPFDIPGVVVTEMGNDLHEKWQKTAGEVFPDMEFEVATTIPGVCRGRADGWQPTTKTAWEFKTMGGFKFKKVCGISGYKRVGGGGPLRAWVMQGGLNCEALEADTLVITATTTEAISIGAAQVLGLEDWQRVAIEWTIPYDSIREEVQNEIENWKTIISMVREDGVLPAPMYVEDTGEVVLLDPTGKHWKCQYCRFHDDCVASLA